MLSVAPLTHVAKRSAARVCSGSTRTKWDTAPYPSVSVQRRSRPHLGDELDQEGEMEQKDIYSTHFLPEVK